MPKCSKKRRSSVATTAWIKYREFVERDLVVVQDAAPPDLLAIAVEKGHREIGFFQPIVVLR